jgi:hypothetical protein
MTGKGIAMKETCTRSLLPGSEKLTNNEKFSAFRNHLDGSRTDSSGNRKRAELSGEDEHTFSLPLIFPVGEDEPNRNSGFIA